MLSADSNSESVACLPEFIYARHILIPIKCDVSFGGARYVDSISWNLFHSMLTPDEFSARTCSDLGLPIGFQNRIAIQISEQIAAYRELVVALHSYAEGDARWAAKRKEHQVISVGIRHNTVDLSDRFTWDLSSNDISPEDFARITCSDLGLPSDMEPVISHKIRETLFRLLISWADDVQLLASTNPSVAKDAIRPSDIKVYLASQYSSLEMITNLWKRAKPNSIEDVASVPQPTLPTDKDSNASVWVGKK